MSGIQICFILYNNDLLHFFFCMKINLMHGRHDDLNLNGGVLEVAIRDLVSGRLGEPCQPCQDQDYDFIEA